MVGSDSRCSTILLFSCNSLCYAGCVVARFIEVSGDAEFVVTVSNILLYPMGRHYSGIWSGFGPMTGIIFSVVYIPFLISFSCFESRDFRRC